VLCVNKDPYGMADFKRKLDHYQDLHMDFLFCSECIKEFDPFACVVPPNLRERVGSHIYSEVLRCPGCAVFLGYLSLGKNSPFIVSRFRIWG
jgi:hypothetical protein